ncbi:MAG: 3,4-dihydroxy-2-butanone-4-phosphate synthase [Planctomycetota bacterium]
MPLSPIPDILQDLRDGKIVVLVDDENRENEGDFICAAEFISVDIINFMTRIGGGYLCVPMTSADCDRLELGPQANVNTSWLGTPLTVSVDGHRKHGVSTGISATDRVKTIQMLMDPDSEPGDFVRPGHINPLRARDGGVLVRTGQTEGTVDLCKLAGLNPTGVLIEVVKPDGEMARMPDLEVICAEHDLKICSVEQIIQYRLERESLVQREESIDGTVIHTPYGDFNLYMYRTAIDPLPHVALTCGDVGQRDANGHPIQRTAPTLVRMHRRNLLGDVFDEASRPTGAQLRASMRMIQEEGAGAIVYLRPESTGDELADQLLRINRPEIDDVNAPDLTRPDGLADTPNIRVQRDIGTGGQILRDLGLTKLRILTNHPKALLGLAGFELEVVEQVAIATEFAGRPD